MALSQRPFGVAQGTANPGQAPAMNSLPVPSKALPVALTGNVLTTEQQVMNGALTTVPLSIAIPPNTLLDQQPFDLNASGAINFGAAGNVTLKLYAGASTTLANNTLIKSSGAIAGAGAGRTPFWILGRFIFDSASGLLQGRAEVFINNTIVAASVLQNNVTLVNNNNSPVVVFSLSIQWSVGNANNLINIQNFTAG